MTAFVLFSHRKWILRNILYFGIGSHKVIKRVINVRTHENGGSFDCLSSSCFIWQRIIKTKWQRRLEMSNFNRSVHTQTAVSVGFMMENWSCYIVWVVFSSTRLEFYFAKHGSCQSTAATISSCVCICGVLMFQYFWTEWNRLKPCSRKLRWNLWIQLLSAHQRPSQSSGKYFAYFLHLFIKSLLWEEL